MCQLLFYRLHYLTVLLADVDLEVKSGEAAEADFVLDPIAEIATEAFKEINRGLFLIYWKDAHIDRSVYEIRRDVCTKHGDQGLPIGFPCDEAARCLSDFASGKI